MAIKEFFIPSGTNAVVSLNLDDVKYTSALRTILGITSTIANGTQKYPYRSIRGALRSGAIVRLRAVAKSPDGKKRRNAFFVCDKDNSDTAGAALVGTNVKIGIGAGINYEITGVTVG